MDRCPSDAELIEHMQADADAPDLDAHITACVSCRDRLDRLIEEQAPFDIAALRTASPDRPACLDAWRDSPPPLVLARSPKREYDPTQPDVPGYVILEELGRGGMGVVFKAHQLALKRDVALKMILAGAHASREEVARFRTEAEAIARLQHPNIVQVFEVGEHEECMFLALEFCAGGTLERRLAGTPMQPSDAATLLHTLARAIDAAHRANVIHRDLKPANVLLAACTATEAKPQAVVVPKITDFGLAKKLDDKGQTLSGAIMGSPSYMPPEQARGDKTLGPPADIYALGAILYECLTGRPPFRAASTVDTLAQVMNEEPVAPRQLNAKVPVDLETIALTCLKKEPGKRYASARELSDELGRFLAGEPIRARRPSWLERAVKWSLRHPARAAALGLLMSSVVLLLVIVAGGWQYSLDIHTKNKELETTNQALDAKIDELGVENGHRREAEKQAKANADDAEERRVQAVERAVSMTTSTGQRYLAEGDLFAALLYFSEAAMLDDKASPRQALHRLRLNALVRNSPRLLRLWTHPAAVTHLDFSRDGKRILVGTADGTARLWNAESGKSIGDPMPHGAALTSATFTPDGRWALTGAADGVVRRWKVDDATLAGSSAKLNLPVVHLAFNPAKAEQAVVVCGNRFAATVYGNPVPMMRPMQIMTGTGPGGVPRFTTIYVPDHSSVVHNVTPRGFAQLWNVAKDAPSGGPMSQTGWINHAVFSRDGARLVTGSGSLEQSSFLQVWDAATGKQEKVRIRLAQPVTQVALSPDGRFLASATGRPEMGAGEARLFNADSGQPVGVAMKHAGAVVMLTFSPDGRSLLTASEDETARLYDGQTGAPRLLPWKHRDRLTGAWFSPDGRHVLTASRDGTARVWETTQGTPVTPWLRHGSPLTAAAFAPDSRRLATASRDGAVRLWDLAEPVDGRPRFDHATVLAPATKMRRTYTMGTRTQRVQEVLPDRVATSARFSRDGRLMLTTAGHRVVDLPTGAAPTPASAQIEATHLCLWEADTGRAIAQVPIGLHFTLAALSPDGRRAVVFTGEQENRMTPSLIDTTTGKPVQEMPLKSGERPLDAAFTAAGACRIVTVQAGKVAAKDTSRSKLVVREVDREAPLATLDVGGIVGRVALAGEGRWLFAIVAKVGDAKAKPEWQIQSWDLTRDNVEQNPLSHAHRVTGFVVRKDGAQLVSYGEGVSEATLWDVPSGKPIKALLHGGTVTHAAFSDDGAHLVTASADRTARVWDTSDGKPLTPPLEHRAGVNHVDIAGGLVVTASNDQTARVWSIASGEAVTLRHRDDVLTAVFRPDGKAIVTACADGTAQVWDLGGERTAAEVRELATWLAVHRLDDTGGLSPLNATECSKLGEQLRPRWPSLFAATPREVLAWHRDEAAAAERGGDWIGATPHLERLRTTDSDSATIWARLGRAYAGQQKWEPAAKAYDHAADRGSTELTVWQSALVLNAATGRASEYARRRDALLAKKSAPLSEELLRDCLLMPATASAAKRLEEEAKRLPQETKMSDHGRATLAAVALRAGKAEEAAKELALALKGPLGKSAPWEWLMLSLACQQLNKADEARTWRNKAAEALDPTEPDRRPPPWPARLALQALLREAEGK